MSELTDKVEECKFEDLSIEDQHNGSILSGKYIPDELLCELLSYVNVWSLLRCHLVCKRWKNLIQDYVWKKKAQLILGASFQSSISWESYYEVCKRNPFNRNLIRNHSGQEGMKHWKICGTWGDEENWKIESPPEGALPLPDDPVFEGHNCYFTSRYAETKTQIINLIDEGLSPDFIDRFQPPIQVSDWYSCRSNRFAYYYCDVCLITPGKVVTFYHHQDYFQNDKKGKWSKFFHEFRNYGVGVRRVQLVHQCKTISSFCGEYGGRLAGTSVVVKL
ncbi:F-box only protein 6-like [Microplitis mediator]|uniref:F-box only protein 6-like n=1 Tax=Microplitis mediator TaxID=375433 RepID=UPI002555BE61|nr:F-box only protein 6-like [Microplitis mediator]